MQFSVQMLTPEDLERIHQASLRVVSEVGMALEDNELCEFLHNRGISVDETSHVVRFRPEMVERALSVAPREVS